MGQRAHADAPRGLCADGRGAGPHRRYRPTRQHRSTDKSMSTFDTLVRFDAVGRAHPPGISGCDDIAVNILAVSHPVRASAGPAAATLHEELVDRRPTQARPCMPSLSSRCTGAPPCDAQNGPPLAVLLVPQVLRAFYKQPTTWDHAYVSDMGPSHARAVEASDVLGGSMRRSHQLGGSVRN